MLGSTSIAGGVECALYAYIPKRFPLNFSDTAWATKLPKKIARVDGVPIFKHDSHSHQLPPSFGSTE